MKTDFSQFVKPELAENSVHGRGENIINKMTVLHSFEDCVALIKNAWQQSNRTIIVSFINAHGYNLCLTNETFYKSIMTSDFVFRDGIGMKILYNMVGKDAGINLNGTDFIPHLLATLNEQKIALFGTKKAVLHNAIKHQSLRNHKIVLCENGFLPLQEYTGLVKKTRPEVVLLGMGMPKQEQLSILLKKHLSCSTLIINGGGVLDFMGKKVPRAPFILRKLGLEWLFRFLHEPRRLFKRYIIGNFIFLINVFKTCKAWKRTFTD